MSSDSVQTYSAFLKPLRKYSDVNIISSKGLLIYEPVSSEYRISSYKKLNQPSLPDNLLSLNVSKCRTRGEGKLNLGTNLGQVKIDAYGRADHYIVNDSTELQMTMFLDFFFNDDCINLMIEKLLSYGNLEAVGLTGEIYTKSLGQLLGIEKASKIISEINMYGKLSKMPKKLIHTISIADINLKWNSKTKSYVSVGQIGIGSIGETQINRYVDGFVEIQCKRSGDKLTIYLEPSSYDSYYFSYSRGLMQAYSSHEEFNKFITDTSSDNRQLKKNKREMAYSYYIATKKAVTSFLKKMKSE